MNKKLLVAILLLTLSLLLSCAQAQPPEKSIEQKNADLFTAVDKNDVKAIRTLLNNKADPNHIVSLKNNSVEIKSNLLILAVNNQNHEIVKLLVEAGADVNLRDGFDTPALMYSASAGNFEITNYLIGKGADVNAKDSNGNSVMSAALDSKNQKIIELIREKTKSRAPLVIRLNKETLVKDGDRLCKEQNNCKAALVYYDEAIKTEKSKSLLAEIYKKRAMAHYALKNTENAISDYNEAISRGIKDSGESYFMRGLTKSIHNEKDWQDACKDFELAHKLGFKNSNASPQEKESFNAWVNQYCNQSVLKP